MVSDRILGEGKLHCGSAHIVIDCSQSTILDGANEMTFILANMSGTNSLGVENVGVVDRLNCS